MAFANPRARGCFRGTRFPRRFRFHERTNERTTPSGEEEWSRRALLFVLQSWPSTVRDASSNWKRRPGMRGNENGGADARGIPRSYWKDERLRIKRAYLSTKLEHISNKLSSTLLVFFFSLVSPLPLFDIWSIMKIEQTHLSIFSNLRKVILVTLMI